ncbi:MAG: hypothetical protein EP301_03565 [Gammaproteobacteria bacterium]|nr:MAG: hypothetical protein EP301_03565 [Gammaproteobacteria bacterium]
MGLSWNASNATSCTASGDWGGSRSVNGSQTVGPLSTDVTFVLSCTGSGGEATTSQSITVIQPEPVPTVTLSSSSTSVVSGHSTTLSWTSTNATECSASGAWSGLQALTGNASTDNLTATSTYTLTCTGPGGSGSGSVTVQVTEPPAPTVSVSASSTTVDEGDNVTLSWSATNASSCTATGNWTGSRSASGTSTVGPLTSTSTYGLSCSGDGGSATDEVTVNVTPPPADPPTLNFSSSDDLIDPGGSVTLSWSATNADTCTASGGWSGDKNTSGSELVSGIDNGTTFTLSCSGSGGNVMEMLTVSTLSSVALNWVAPQENVDGTLLTDLAGYRIYYGTSSRNYTGMVELNEPADTSHTLSLASGDYYVAMTALDQEGNESSYSNEVLKSAP